MKETQRLTNMIAFLSRFLPRIVERARPIMNLFQKTKNFVWNDGCKDSFQQLKIMLATPPVLSKPNTSKKSVVYLSISIEPISIVLVQEKGSELRPMYIVS